MKVIALSYFIFLSKIFLTTKSVSGTPKADGTVEDIIRGTYNTLFLELSTLVHMIHVRATYVTKRYPEGKHRLREIIEGKRKILTAFGVDSEVVEKGDLSATDANIPEEKFTLREESRSLSDLEKALENGLPEFVKLYQVWNDVFYENAPHITLSSPGDESNYWDVDAKILYDYFKIWFRDLSAIYDKLEVKATKVTPSEMFAKSIYLQGLEFDSLFGGFRNSFFKPAYAMFAPISFKSDSDFLSRLVDDVVNHRKGSCSGALKSYTDAFHTYTTTIKALKI